MKGSQFEKILYTRSLGQNLVHIALASSGGRFVNVNGKKFFQRLRQPFDFILQNETKSAFIDAKVTSNRKKPQLPLSFFMKDKSTKHQFDTFLGMTGIRGFIVYFKDPDVVSFFHVDHIDSFDNEGTLLGSIDNFDLNRVFESEI